MPVGSILDLLQIKFDTIAWVAERHPAYKNLPHTPKGSFPKQVEKNCGGTV